MDLGQLRITWGSPGWTSGTLQAFVGTSWMDPGPPGWISQPQGTSWVGPGAPGWTWDVQDGPGHPWMDLRQGPGLQRNVLDGPRTSWMDLTPLGVTWVDLGLSPMDLGPLGVTWLDLLHGPGLHGDTWMDPGAPGPSWDLWGSPGWARDHLDTPGDVLWCPGPCGDITDGPLGTRARGSWGHPGGPRTWGDLLGGGTRPV